MVGKYLGQALSLIRDLARMHHKPFAVDRRGRDKRVERSRNEKHGTGSDNYRQRERKVDRNRARKKLFLQLCGVIPSLPEELAGNGRPSFDEKTQTSKSHARVEARSTQRCDTTMCLWGYQCIVSRSSWYSHLAYSPQLGGKCAVHRQHHCLPCFRREGFTHRNFLS